MSGGAFIKVPVLWIEEPELLARMIGEEDETLLRFTALALARLESAPTKGLTIRRIAECLRAREQTARERLRPAIRAGLIEVGPAKRGDQRTRWHRLSRDGRNQTTHAIRQFWMLPSARIEALARPTPLSLVMEAAILDAERRPGSKRITAAQLAKKVNCGYGAAKQHLRLRPPVTEAPAARPPGLYVEPPGGVDLTWLREQLRGSAPFYPGDVPLILAGETIAHVAPTVTLIGELQNHFGCSTALYP